MNILRLISVIVVLFFVANCAVKAPHPDKIQKISKEEALRNVREFTPEFCRLKSKGVFSYEDRFSKVKFKGTIVKTCDGKLKMNVLGMFGQVYLEAIYDGNTLEIMKKGEDISSRYDSFFSEKKVAHLVKLLNVPLLMPYEDYRFDIFASHYVFSKNNTVIYADADFNIVRIRRGTEAVEYKYENNKLVSLEYDGTDQMFKIQLNN
ncbi:MAG: hypothetical protein FXF49_02930 [Flexistipes sinusarabici]|uniref:Outer membrane lipoprotein carrier protein LolA n=1 Tax=Flexistipes sinusarabici TaxID=2352 RepID=A0A5D0MPW3_FLESI|nr:hypothetical protein [Flexistipes sinusarabici]TYB34105.1 MAG: hypothetical protein FXF49_02930 [Flexistipes sinusarabici]